MSATGNITTFDTEAPIPDLSVVELAIVIVTTRQPGIKLGALAQELGRWFGNDVAVAHVELPLRRLVTRECVTEQLGNYTATEEARVRAERAAKGLVHLFFRDRYFFDVSKLLEISFVREDGRAQ